MIMFFAKSIQYVLKCSNLLHNTFNAKAIRLIKSNIATRKLVSMYYIVDRLCIY